MKLISLAFLALATGSALGAEQVIINRFDTSAETARWRYDFGGVLDRSFEFDPTMDADGNSSSGALKFTLRFDTAYGGNNQIAFTRDIFPAIDGNQYDRLEMDVRVDPSSPVGTSGAYGLFQTVIRNTGNYNYNALAEAPLTNADQWIHINPRLTGPVEAIRGITWKIWGGSGQNLSGTYVLWIDNVVISPPPSTSPPPALVMEPLIPGLEIYASLGAQYQRQDIRTVGADYSWLGQFVGGPVTYSFTITNFPGATNNAFETRMLLVGNNSTPGDQADYNQANVVYLRILENPGGSGYVAELRYKVNAPGASIFDGPLVGRFTTPNILGTWGMTLEYTNAIIFAPDGSTTNGFFGPEVLTGFEQFTAVYIGIIPNETANVGQSVVFSGVSVSGANTPLVDNFSTLDNWNITVAQDPAGVVLVPPDAIRKLTWPSAAAGFTLHSVADITEDPSWPASPIQVRTVGAKKLALLGPDTGNSFLRLEKPPPPP